MAQPTAGDVWVSRPLTNMSLATTQADNNFIATKVFPMLGVANQTGLIWRYDDGDFLRDEAKLRAPGTPSAGSGFKVDHDLDYKCLIKAIHKDIDDPTRANADSVLQLDAAAVKWATQKMMIAREVQWATNYFTSGVWGTSATAGTLWTDPLSTPKQDIGTGKIAVLSRTGFEPRTLVLGYRLFIALQNNKDVRSQFQYTSAESINENMMAGYFDVDQVLVSRAIKATSHEGETITTNFIGGDDALLVYTDPNPGLMSLTAGVTFCWSGFTGSVSGIRVKRFRIEELSSDRIEMEMAQDMKVLAPQLGYFLSGLI